MDTVAHFMIGLLVYGAGPSAIAYMVYHFLKEAEPRRPSKPGFGLGHTKHRHVHFGRRWAGF